MKHSLETYGDYEFRNEIGKKRLKIVGQNGQSSCVIIGNEHCGPSV